MKKTLTGYYSGNFPFHEAMLMAGIKHGARVEMEVNGDSVTIRRAKATFEERVAYATRYTYPYRKDWIFSHRTTQGGFYVTTATGEFNGKVCVGHAICRPDDQCSAHIGNAIALIRALGGEVPPMLTGQE